MRNNHYFRNNYFMTGSIIVIHGVNYVNSAQHVGALLISEVDFFNNFRGR